MRNWGRRAVRALEMTTVPSMRPEEVVAFGGASGGVCAATLEAARKVRAATERRRRARGMSGR